MQVYSLEEIPLFNSEDEERNFWEIHGLSDKLWDKLYDSNVDKKERILERKLRPTDRRKKTR